MTVAEPPGQVPRDRAPRHGSERFRGFVAAASATRGRLWLIRGAIVLFWIVVGVVVVGQARQALVLPSGVELNRLAWEGSYRERGLPVPPDGPRDGYWGQRKPQQVRDRDMGWREPTVRVPGLLDHDAHGFQRAGSAGPGARRVLIVGGSVALGAYSSTQDRAYFSQLAGQLERALGPVEILVIAAGSWESDNELAALRRHGLAFDADLVLFLNGLNDVMHPSERLRRRHGWPMFPPEERVARYLGNMATAQALVRERGAGVVFSLQPFLPQKVRKTRLEERIIELSFTGGLTVDFARGAYAELRQGLVDLERVGGTRFVDLSGVFDRETATTFADIWHFGDTGHDLLAAALAPELERLLATTPPRDRAAAAAQR